MQVRIAQDAPTAVRAGALVLPVFSDAALTGAALAIDEALDGAIAEIVQSGEMKGKPYEHALIHAKGRTFNRVLLIGLGESAKFEPKMLARYAGSAVRHLGRRNIGDVAVVLPQHAKGNETACAAFAAEGAIAGSFDTSLYQDKPEKGMSVETLTLLGSDLDSAAMQAGVNRGTIVGDAVNFARRLAITPANDMTPTILAERATDACKESGVDIDVFDEARIRKEAMGSFLSVAQGSVQPPKFIVMRYNGDPSSDELLALVGKGITFDSGGISLKPPERMEEMKYD
ncbi:MAG: hypothetical protein M3R51_10685, partial [Candidatus Eremiobacteraeota bacterium]|nr:hypothetical protein [Candidatus Eremiobacteraeota bacterium]